MSRLPLVPKYDLFLDEWSPFCFVGPIKLQALGVPCLFFPKRPNWIELQNPPAFTLAF